MGRVDTTSEHESVWGVGRGLGVLAVVVSGFGGPGVLQLRRLPAPRLQPGHVLVRVSAAAVNPTDVLLRVGAQMRFLRGIEPPYIPGMDLAGVVEQTADPRWAVGERVMGAVSAWRRCGGAQAELVLVPGDSLARLPDGLTDEEASTLPMNGLTAQACVSAASVPPGGSLMVIGGAGAVGGMTIQIARSQGIRVLADAAPGDEQLVRELGADVVVPRGEDGCAAAREAVPAGVDAVVDTAAIGQAALGFLRAGGNLVSVRPGPPLEMPPGVRLHHVFVPDHLHDSGGLARLAALARAGQVAARVAEVFPPQRVQAAHRLTERRGVRGRAVLRF